MGSHVLCVGVQITILDAIDDAPLKASDVEDMESRLKILSG